MNFKGLGGPLVAVILSFLALISRVEARLTRVPSDTQALVGDSVRLHCFTDNKNYPPSWSHKKVGSTEPSDVYMTVRDGNRMVVGRMTEEYYGRFQVKEDRTTGEYSLDITGVQLDDAGRYTCTARGGLGQSAAAELGVIEASPHCASNITEAIGENICDIEPDHIGLSCGFRYRGNTLPSVMWLKTDQPGRAVRIERSQWDGESGWAVSNFVLKAGTDYLNGTSFTCVISSSSDASVGKLSCTTPVISVLKIANTSESRTLVEPDEVQCNPLPQLTMYQTGYNWVKRKQGEDSKEIVVAESSLLNLFRPEFQSGIYVCIVEYDIRGQPCPVEALTIFYERTGSNPVDPEASSAIPTLAIIVPSVVLSVAVILVVTFIITQFYRKHAARSKDSEQSAGKSTNLMEKQSTSISVSGSSDSIEREPLTGGLESVCNSSGRASEQRLTLSEDLSPTGDDVALDITDSSKPIGRQGDRELRNQLAVEKALTRMRKNSVFRQGTDNAGLSSSTDDADVAEGISRAPETSKDE